MNKQSDLDLLRFFGVLMSERSVSRSARRSGLSQPAASHALARLRRMFSDRLLVPSRDGMVPTPRAFDIERGLAALIEQFDDLVEPPDLFRPQNARRRFTVSATEYSEFLLMPPLIERVRRIAPNIQIDVRAPNQDLMPSWLESGQVDLRVAWLTRPTPTLRSQALFTDRLVCIARKGHPRVRGDISVPLYLGLRHVRPALVGRTTIGQEIDKVVEKAGGRLDIALHVPNFLTIPYIVATCDLVATVPQRMADAFSAHLPLQTLELPLSMPTMRYSAYWHDRNQSDAGHRWFRRMVMDAARALGKRSAPSRRSE